MINTFNIPLHSNIGRRPISHSAFRISPTHHPKSKIKTPHDLLRTLRTGCEILNESTIPIRNADVPIGINPTLVTRYSQQRLRRQSTIQPRLPRHDPIEKPEIFQLHRNTFFSP
jgi:hypothetical protein